MSDGIITADEAKALAAKWRRLDGPYSVSWDDEGDCVIHCEDTTIARVAHIDGGYTEMLARLFAAAPDDVKRLATSVVTLCDAADASARRNGDLRRDVELLTRDRDSLTASRDAAFDRLVSRVWRAATGDTHEGPESVEVLLAAVEGLRTDLADTRAALRAHLHCDECDELATRTHAATASFCCDAHAVGEGWSDTTHAAAVRAAMEGGR